MKSEMPQAVEALKSIVEMELAGVVRFTHYALMVRGPYRLPIVAFLQQQASESLLHAQRAGEIMTGLGGHPSMRISKIEETGQHAIKDILEESWAHEKRAIELYRSLLDVVAGKNIFLEEYARSMVAAEEEHVMELTKMVRDFED
jgi:bacterioferritin